MTDLQQPPARRTHPVQPARERIPFPTVDEISQHCRTDEEPETVHLEVHLPGQVAPARLRAAFLEALHRHPRILMRQAPGRWYRRRYEWELTGTPDVDPVVLPPPGPDALAQARARALTHCPPLSTAPPVRLEVVVPDPRGGGCVLLLTINHTALDGPACLRVLATAAELYGGVDNSPAPPPAPAAGPAAGAGRAPAVPSAGGGPWWVRPVRIAADTQNPAGGNGMVLADLPVPQRAAPHTGDPAPYTVNDQLLVATSLMVGHWNRLHGRPAGPVRITMPVDTRPRGPRMPIGNGTRLVEVVMAPQDPADEALLAADRPDATAVARLLRQTAERTRALKAAPRPPLGRGAALLTAPVLPVGVRGALTRGLRRAVGPWSSTTLLSNIGRVPYPLDFGDAGRARAVWFSAPARMPRGLTLTTASTGGRLHLALRWSRALLDDEAAAALCRIFERSLFAASTTFGSQA